MTTVKKIDRRKKYMMMVDVETTLSDGNEQIIFDLGFAIFTKDGSVYEKRSYVIAEVFDNYNLMSRAYYFSKYPKYLKGLESGEFVKAHWVTAITEMMNLINQYDVKEVVAYNLAFDLRAIKKTNEYIRNREFKLFDNLKQECLWNKAVETICQQKSYKAFCKKHGLIAPSGKFYKTSAESVFAYMENNPSFEEEHTGLEDVLIEIKIYNRVMRQKKKMTKGIVNQPYKKAMID